MNEHSLRWRKVETSPDPRRAMRVEEHYEAEGAVASYTLRKEHMQFCDPQWALTSRYRHGTKHVLMTWGKAEGMRHAQETEDSHR